MTRRIRRFPVATLSLALLLACGSATAQQSIDKVLGSITAQAGQAYGDLETVNGGIFVDRGGKVSKGIENVNGSIGIVGTDVGGGIESVNADITVGAGSHVRGGIKLEKNESWFKNMKKGKNSRDPRVIIGPNAVVQGPLVFERPVKLYVHSSAKIGPVTGATPTAYSTDTAPSQ